MLRFLTILGTKHWPFWTFSQAKHESQWVATQATQVGFPLKDVRSMFFWGFGDPTWRQLYWSPQRIPKNFLQKAWKFQNKNETKSKKNANLYIDFFVESLTPGLQEMKKMIPQESCCNIMVSQPTPISGTPMTNKALIRGY